MDWKLKDSNMKEQPTAVKTDRGTTANDFFVNAPPDIRARALDIAFAQREHVQWGPFVKCYDRTTQRILTSEFAETSHAHIVSAIRQYLRFFPHNLWQMILNTCYVYMKSVHF